MQPTLGTRASSPAKMAGEDARAPRQIAVITVSYIEAQMVKRTKEGITNNYKDYRMMPSIQVLRPTEVRRLPRLHTSLMPSLTYIHASEAARTTAGGRGVFNLFALFL